jgi:catechol 2,3-dioxygenase-like lactoylglutathione lyase family enzyme
MTLHIRGLAPLLQVFDMPASIHFYRDILGFEVVNTSGPGDDVGWALLRLNGVELMLNTLMKETTAHLFSTQTVCLRTAIPACSLVARMSNRLTFSCVSRALM